MPVLIDRNVMVSDSTAFLEYLEDRFSRPQLLPHAPRRVRRGGGADGCDRQTITVPAGDGANIATTGATG